MYNRMGFVSRSYGQWHTEYNSMLRGTKKTQEFPLMPPGSRYVAEPMDYSTRRSIEIRPAGHDGSARIDPADACVVVDYSFHDGVYWRAAIPLHGVDTILGQAFNFSKPKTKMGKNGPQTVFGTDGLPRRTIGILNHVQSRFMLKSDHEVELYPLDGNDTRNPDETRNPTHRLKDFVYSVETVGPVGVLFNLRDALAGNLMSAHRFLSTQEMVFERIVVEGQYVTESPPLPLNDHEKRTVLVESLLRSHRAGLGERYYLYRTCRTNNCTSSPFQILDTAVDYTLAQRAGSLLYRLPLNPRFYLRMRGMDSDRTVRKLVRTEFADYIAKAETKQRKRDYVRSRTRAIRAARQRRKDK